MKSNSVLKAWVCSLSWKKQTVLIGAIRSPDTLTPLKLKQATIWIRQHILDREFERLPLHAAHHILLAFEVIGFEHPDTDVARTAMKFYLDGVDAQHLNPETKDQYESRYMDASERVKLGTS